MKFILGNLPGFFSDTYSWTPHGSTGLRTKFILPIIQGWLAAPLILTCLVGGFESLVLWLGRFCCFVLIGQVNVSVVACNATGLDAVQRLEQKKFNPDDEEAASICVTFDKSA